MKRRVLIALAFVVATAGVVTAIALPSIDPCRVGDQFIPGCRLGYLIGLRSIGTTGLKVTVFTGQTRSAWEQAEGSAQYEVRNVHLDDVLIGKGGMRTAVVSYETVWSGKEWPGYADCRVDIVDGTGTRIASQAFETMSVLPKPPPYVAPVKVPSGDPADADISCGQAHRPSASAAYVISDPVVAEGWNAPRLMFNVTWATEEPPSYQACEAELRRSDGTIGRYPFGLAAGPGQSVVLLTDEFAGAIPRDVSCHLYRTPDEG